MNEFGTVLRNARHDMLLSQEKLADKLGVAQTVISQYERGYRKPNVEKMRKLYTIVPPCYLKRLINAHANFEFDKHRKPKSRKTS